jgi:biopolymer transport protein ExbD
LQTISEINLTPLMDLTFILLITFIITFPLIEQAIPINLPQGKADDLEEQDSRTISMDLSDRIYLDDRQIEMKALAEEMRLLGQAAPDTTVLVRADEGIAYGKIVEVLRILHDARISRMALVTQADEKTGP